MNKHLEIAYHHLVNGLTSFPVNSPQWRFCLTCLVGYGTMNHELDCEKGDDDDDGECDLCARCQCSS